MVFEARHSTIKFFVCVSSVWAERRENCARREGPIVAGRICLESEDGEGERVWKRGWMRAKGCAGRVVVEISFCVGGVGMLDMVCRALGLQVSVGDLCGGKRNDE